MLRKIAPNIFRLLLVSFLLPGCATIFGGSRYHAKVRVPEHHDAKIEYGGVEVGIGEASFKVERKYADNFSVTIKKEGCETQTHQFKGKTFRGWAFTGTLLGWTVIAGGIPIPFGVLIDAATGAWWKPDISEVGVSKEDYNHFSYIVNYTGCKGNLTSPKQTKSKTEMLSDIKKLYDEGVLTEEEFNEEKKKILEKEY